MTTQVGTSLRGWIEKVSSDPDFRFSVVVYLVMSVAISLWMALAQAVTDAPTTPDDLSRPYQGVDPITGGPADLFLEVRQRPKALCYLAIPGGRYSAYNGSTVYSPLYPFLN